MLQDILKIINRDSYISKTRIARELNIHEGVVEDAINRLVEMGYLSEEKTSADCADSCKGCPFAKSCNKEIVKAFKLSEKGSRYI